MKEGILFRTGVLLGNDIFFTEQRRDNFSRHQVLIDSKGNLINENLYTGGGWGVRTGAGWRYTMSIDELTPQAMFACYNGFGAAAKSGKYEIKLINSKGKEIAILKRNIPKEKVTKKDKKYFMQKIYETHTA